MNGKKGIVSLLLLIGIIWMISSTTIVVNANTEREIQQERSAVQSELKQKREELNNIQAGLVELEAEINLINEVIKENEKEMNKTEVHITEVEQDIFELEEEIAGLKKDIERRHDLLKERASALQRSGGTLSYIDVLFGAQSFIDLIDRISLVTKIAQSDQNLMTQLKEDQEEIENQMLALDDKLIELEDVKAELEYIQLITLQQKEEQQDKRAVLVEERKKSEALIKELELEDRELKQMLDAARSAAEARRREEEARRLAAQRLIQYSSETVSSSSSPISNDSSLSGSGDINNIIRAGYRYIGNSRYKFAGGRTASDIANGLFDCSGFVAWAFRQEGKVIPASTSGLSTIGTRVSPSDMRPGDLVFFDTYKTNGHVGIYIGNQQFIGSQTSTGVDIASMNDSYWANRFKGHVRRVIN